MIAQIKNPLLLILLTSLLSTSAFAASPRINYLLYCSGCHLVNGEGKPPNVPTLREELGNMVNVEEMRSYLLRIPGASQAPINDAELAEVINWVLQEFNANTLPSGFEKYTGEEVSEARKHVLADPLSYRAEYWRAYSD